MDRANIEGIAALSSSIASESGGSVSITALKNCLTQRCQRVVGKARSKTSKGACLDADSRRAARDHCRSLQLQLSQSLLGWCKDQCEHHADELERPACTRQCQYKQAVKDSLYKTCYDDAFVAASSACLVNKCKDEAKACAAKHCRLNVQN